MKKFLICSLFILLSAFSFVNAQQNIYAGASFGVSTVSAFGLTDTATIPITLHVGLEDLVIDNLDVRLDTNFLLNADLTTFALGVNGLYNFDLIPDQPIGFYAGGGIRTIIGDDTANVGLGAIAGADYRIVPQVSIFGELRSDVYFSDPITSGLGIGIGANYHF